MTKTEIIALAHSVWHADLESIGICNLVEFAELVAAKEREAWQPIETAPVAKGIIAVWRPIDHVDRPFHKEIVTGSRCFDMNTYKPTGKFYSGGMYYDEAAHITHWMPLPPPPKADLSDLDSLAGIQGVGL